MAAVFFPFVGKGSVFTKEAGQSSVKIRLNFLTQLLNKVRRQEVFVSVCYKCCLKAKSYF